MNKKFLLIQAAIIGIFSLNLNYFASAAEPLKYEPRGIGGGGAMSGFSISPFDSNLWFIGTDMGTLFRSLDKGKKWEAISHSEATYFADLNNAANIGFSADKKTVFHAFGGCIPQKSNDLGNTWSVMTNLWQQISKGNYYYCWDYENKSKIRYYLSHFTDENLIFAAAGDGLYRTEDKGETWIKVPGIDGESKGTFIDYGNPVQIYHANEKGIYVSKDLGKTFSLYHAASLHAFAGGRDAKGLTLAYINNDASICTKQGITSDAAKCGYVWIQKNNGNFVKTAQIGGDFVRMAENDSQIIYVTGSRDWVKEPGIGTSVWISKDGGTNFTQTFQQYVDHGPWYSWDPALFEKSAVAYDVGLHDGGYLSFTVNPRNSSEAGGSEYYFLHISFNQGVHWKSPITEFADSGERGPKKKWKSIGLEVTSSHLLKFHPNNPLIGYAGYSDIGGLATNDKGNTWYLTRFINSIYDYAFDENNDQLVFAAASSHHDWPHGGWKNVHVNSSTDKELTYNGGIYLSSDRGLTWNRLTPDNWEWNTPFLSVAFDTKNSILYAGSQGWGIARSKDRGKTWEWFNQGLPQSKKIIGQIEIDPEFGTVYALLTGDAPTYSNTEETGIYKLNTATSTWELLRGTVHPPYEKDGNAWAKKLWNYPVHFAIDYKDSSRKTMWLTDVRVPTEYLAEGLWKTVDGGKNWYQKYTMPNPGRITLHPTNSQIVYLSGMVDLPGFSEEKNSGALYSLDGGENWQKNFAIPVHHILSSMVFDPSDSNKVFYTTFGAGMFYGPNPAVSNELSSLSTNPSPPSSRSPNLPPASPLASSIGYIDIVNHFALTSIKELAAKGVFDNGTYFYPERNLNRAEFMKILCKSFKMNLPANYSLTVFKDVKGTEWFAPYVELAYKNEIITAGDGFFRAEGKITFDDAVKLLKLAATNVLKKEVKDATKAWFYFDYKPLTRGEGAALIDRLLKELNI